MHECTSVGTDCAKAQGAPEWLVRVVRYIVCYAMCVHMPKHEVTW